jgi:hypothetical protein
MAEPVFDSEPTVDDVDGIQGWRWPIIFWRQRYGERS